MSLGDKTRFHPGQRGDVTESGAPYTFKVETKVPSYKETGLSSVSNMLANLSTASVTHT